VNRGLAITVDVDGEAGLAGPARAWDARLTSRSERLYGLLRGLPRILRALEDHDAVATFYVPGVTALRHPEAIASLLDRGHELGHHGHTHGRLNELGEADQRQDLELGLEALSRFGPRPLGYRAPAWELTPFTLDLLTEHGFGWDSSLMGDDRPYVVPVGGGTIVELPVHWSLDDAPFFAGAPSGLGLWESWSRELELAASEDRTITLTLHPEILGRPHRADLLQRVLARARSLDLPVLTHGAVADRVRSATRCPPPVQPR
jgi:peptidoglycan/xylan/chitin deacetylase (PgdA/CDA1 family)